MKPALIALVTVAAFASPTIDMRAIQSTAKAQPIEQRFPHASLNQICGKLVTDDLQACMAKKNQYDLQYQSCTQYGLEAFQTFVLKRGGKPEQFTIQVMTAHAYGPGGLAFQGSEQTAALLGRLVTAAYHGNYGKTPEEFSEYAFRICIRGEPF